MKAQRAELADEIIMPFGICKGKSVSEVPTSYLRYLLDQEWFVDRDDDLVVAVETEYNFRKEWGK
jgi:uncharacterized protein (DUF3820 family)